MCAQKQSGVVITCKGTHGHIQPSCGGEPIFYHVKDVQSYRLDVGNIVTYQAVAAV